MLNILLLIVDSEVVSIIKLRMLVVKVMFICWNVSMNGLLVVLI